MWNFWKSKTGIATSITVGVAIVLAVAGWIFESSGGTYYAPQSQENSPGSLQIQGNGNTVTQGSSPTLVSYLHSETFDPKTTTYQTTFEVDISVPGNNPMMKPKSAVGYLICSPATYLRGGTVEMGGQTETTYYYDINCNSEQKLSGTENALFTAY